MKSWSEQKALVAKAKSEFPETFEIKQGGMAQTKGRKFRVSDAHSYVNDNGVVMLYTEILKEDGSWAAFAKGTVEELRQYVIRPAVETKMYSIRCEVSGGVTGYRTALLKRNGEIAVFETEQEARDEAKRLNEKMNGPHATASFKYSVVDCVAKEDEKEPDPAKFAGGW